MKSLDDLSLFEGYFEESQVNILIASTNKANRHIVHENEIDSSEFKDAYVEGIEIYNYWSQNINTCNRSGLYVEHSPVKRPKSLNDDIALVIKRTIRYSERYVNFDATQLLNDAIDNAEHAAIRFSLHKSMDMDALRSAHTEFLKTRYLTYYIVIGHKGLSSLVENDICLYIKEPDMLLGAMSPDRMVKHPYVTESVPKQRFHSKENDVCRVSYELIDNEDSVGAVFIPEGNDIFKLVPRKSANKSSGLYITKVGLEQSIHGGKKDEKRMISIDQIFEQPNVFKTRDEAIAKSEIKTQQEAQSISEKYNAEREKRLHETSMRTMERDERVRKSSVDSNMTYVKLAAGITSAMLTTVTLLIKALK